MRLHIVTDTYPPDLNALSTALASWVNCLRQDGNEVLVFRPGSACSDQEKSLPSVPLSRFTEQRLGLPSRKKLKHVWSQARPDILYVATAGPLGISAIKAAKDLEIPVVTGLRPLVMDVFPYSLFSIFEKNVLKYLKKHFNRTNLTLVPSEEIRKELIQAGFLNVEVQPDGVDAQLYSPSKRDYSLRADWGVRKKTLVVGLSGPVENEIMRSIIHLLHHLQEEGHDLIGVVMGDGSDKAELSAHYPDLVFLPQFRSESLAAAYASLDLLIHPDSSGSHTTDLLKSLSSGLITIAYANSDTERIIRPGDNAYLVQGDNPILVQKAIEDALLHLSEDDPMRKKARESVSSWSWESSTRQLAGHLQNVLAAQQEKQNVAETTLSGSIFQGILKCESVFLSDIHLGTPDSKAREAVKLLKHIRCRKIVLVGDIIDAWALKRGGIWDNRHSRFVRTLLKKMEKENCEIIYIRGNHDEILERFIPLVLGNLTIHKEYIHQGKDGKQYLVTHGDGFDSISTNHKWLAMLGSVGYDFLLAFNRYYNRWRSWRGKDYYSLSKAVKSKVKSAVSYIGRYEEQLQCLAEHKKCDGIICGHIHSPADKMIGDIRYLNCGDWVESMTFVMETCEGDFQVHPYASLSDLGNKRENDVKKIS